MPYCEQQRENDDTNTSFSDNSSFSSFFGTDTIDHASLPDDRTKISKNTTSSSNSSIHLDSHTENSPDEQPIIDSSTSPSPPAPYRTRSGRAIKKPNRLIESYHILSPKRKIPLRTFHDQFLMSMKWDEITSYLTNEYKQLLTFIENNTDLNENTTETYPFSIFSAKANSEDLPTWEEAMNGPDQEGYRIAMQIEIETLYHQMKT